MTPGKSLPISCADDVYVQLDRRPLTPRRYGAIRDCGPWRPGEPMMHAGVDEHADTDGRFYEVIVHFAWTTRDDRCVVARFRTLQEVNAEVEALAILWFVNYGMRPSEGEPRGFTPCPN